MIKDMKLSVVIPIYNEKKTLKSLIEAIRAVSLSEMIEAKEIVLVDDCSTDGTREILQKIEINGSSQRLEPTMILQKIENSERGLELMNKQITEETDSSQRLESIIERFKPTIEIKKIKQKFEKKDDKSEQWEIKIFYHKKNQGKGAALKTGFSQVSGDIVIIQDADLEYDPQEYSKLLKPILSDKADVVYGSRFIGGGSHRVLYFWHYAMNRFLTLLSNAFSDLNLTDMETCYKVFRRSVLEKIDLKEKRFGFEPEITAKIGALFRKKGLRIYEVGIAYYGRTYAEGKKIGWRDGVWALWCVVKYNFQARWEKK